MRLPIGSSYVGRVSIGASQALLTNSVIFDDTPVELFDLSAEGFVDLITIWKLGTGAATSMDLTGSGPYSIDPIHSTGTVTAVRVYEDRFVFEVNIPAGTILTAGVDQLGLYTEDSLNALVIGVTFPKIYTGTVEIIKFTITVNRHV